MPKRFSAPAALLFLILSWGFAVEAAEFQPYTGVMNYERLSGCCESTGANAGFGALVRTDMGSLGVWDASGYTDRAWTEFLLMKPFYLKGAYHSADPTNDHDVSVERVPHWEFVQSLGVGTFVHSTTTESYSLPARVTGLSFGAQSQLRYTINQELSAVGILHLGAGLGSDDRGILWGFFLGLNYRPSK